MPVGLLGVGDPDEAGLRGDRAGHGGKVVAVVRVEGHLDQPRGGKMGGGVVAAEAGIAHHHRVSLFEQHQSEKVDQLVAAVADEDLRRRDAVLFGESGAEGVRRAVGVDVHGGGGGLDRLDGLGGGAERVLVAGEFDDPGES